MALNDISIWSASVYRKYRFVNLSFVFVQKKEKRTEN